MMFSAVPDLDGVSSPGLTRVQASTPMTIDSSSSTSGAPRSVKHLRSSSGPDGLALVPLGTISILVAALLIAFANGYGYHRDELYFLAAGRHLAWAYPDQGVLTPLIARLMSDVAPGSLNVLRVPSALMAAGVVFTTGLTAFEFGGARRAQVIACACAAVSSVVLIAGHLLSTTTFDLLAWAVACWLLTRILRTGEQPLWLAVGVLTGAALLNKPLIALFFLAFGASLVLAGPRRPFRTPWLYVGGAIALAMWTPWLLWQAKHGWPQLHISSAIASGSSASSQPRWAFLPFQLLLVSPVLAPIWILGLSDLLRSERLKPFRALGVAWLFLAAAFLVAGGKPYYLAGMFPPLLAAGSLRAADWTARGRQQTHRVVLWAAIGLSGVVSVVIALPVLPAGETSAIVAINADAGETIGWPQFVGQVAGVYRRSGQSGVIFTANYGEAGAIDRYGPSLGLPTAYSGHNGFAIWGPPSVSPGQTIVIGLSAARLRRWFLGCVAADDVQNSAGISNQEQGVPIDVCSKPRQPWRLLWPRLRHLS